MAIEFGDIWPQVSGSASLGAEMTNGGFTGEARPFAHMHANSGVFHEPFGTSGILRFARDSRANANEVAVFRNVGFEFSVDGGLTYPLRVSQNNLLNTWPVVDAVDTRLELRGSGLTCTSVGSLDLTAIAGAINLTTQFGYKQAINISADNQLNFGSSSVVGGILNNIGAKLFTLYSNISLEAGVVGANVGDISMLAWASSGQMKYRFGPHQSWHIKTSHASTGGPANDGFWPISHSGNIAQMIAQASGQISLQAAYNNGRIIDVSSQNQPVRLIGSATSSPLRLETGSNYPHIEVSGLVIPPTGGFWEANSLLFMQHSAALWDFAALGGLAGITTKLDASARSLGPESLWLHAGNSGVLQVRTASGIAQFFNTAASAALDTTGLNAPFVVGGQSVVDSFYRAVASSGVSVIVPGLYKAIYSLSVQKTAGNLTQQVNTQLRVSDKLGQTFQIFGGDSYATVRDSNALNLGTANGQCVFDLVPGDVVNVFAVLSENAVAPNSCRILARGCNLILEFLGPKRSLTSVRNKVS